MTAIDVIYNLLNTKLINYNLKYCLVTENKIPKKINGDLLKPNRISDFSDFNELCQCDSLEKYAGVGISIQGSDICAIDVDHCFDIPNDIDSIDERGKDILNLFKEVGYSEFSFSGTGLRVLFKAPLIENYSSMYYIKNKNNNIEFYQPSKSFRYVTITGNTINNNDLLNSNLVNESLNVFLNKYMRRTQKEKNKIDVVSNTDSLESLMKKTKILYFKNSHFQDLWFSKAPGSGKNESELDYELIANIYEHITQNKEYIKEIFESSPYFKSKDFKHKKKWENQENRYYNYVFDQIERSHTL